MLIVAAPAATAFMEETQLDATVLAGLVLVLWLTSVGLRRNWPADLIWPVWPLLHAVLIMRRQWPHDMYVQYVRKLIVLFLLGQWTHRLVSLRAMRGEDWRWALLRDRLGDVGRRHRVGRHLRAASGVSVRHCASRAISELAVLGKLSRVRWCAPK